MKKSYVLFLTAIFVLLTALPTCDILMEECERNNTGTFFVENQSESGRAYKVIIDGISYGIVVAGSSKDWTIAAGQHLVQILFADTDTDACSISAPTVIKCKRSGLVCRS